jgi:hypothetical protein
MRADLHGSRKLYHGSTCSPGVRRKIRPRVRSQRPTLLEHHSLGACGPGDDTLGTPCRLHVASQRRTKKTSVNEESSRAPGKASGREAAPSQIDDLERSLSHVYMAFIRVLEYTEAFW